MRQVEKKNTAEQDAGPVESERRTRQRMRMMRKSRAAADEHGVRRLKVGPGWDKGN